MHLDLLPSRHARWHSHHNLLPGMVDEELLTRLDARRHLYGKEWHAPHKCVRQRRICGSTPGVPGRDRFLATSKENRGLCVSPHDEDMG